MKLLAIAALTLLSLPAQGPSNGIFGNWSNPTGSIIQIFHCGKDACARIIVISSKAPTHFDAHNPNPALRKRPLCGLQIGSSFHLAGSWRAQGGWLYDPESGKTYHGSMARSGNTLRLRGYVGLSIFGRTEIWTRAPDNLPPCQS